MSDNIQKIRVLQMMHGLSAGGIETYVINLLNNLDKSKFDFTFILSTDYKEINEQTIENMGYKIYKTCDLDTTGKKIRHFFRLIKFIKQKGPFHIAHSHMDFFNGINLLAAFIAGIPVRISHSHKAATMYNRPSLLAFIYQKFSRMAIKLLATYRLGCSAAANRRLYGIKGGAKSSCRVVYNAIPLDKFRKEIYAESEIAPKLHLKNTKINFVTIGRMSKGKNGLFVVDILYELCKLRSDIHLFWIGTGELAGDIRQKVHNCGLGDSVSFLGARQDVPEILSVMDYFLFPSLYEGLGIVIVEAQAMGVHCFISEVIPEEADLGLCTVISLKNGASTWAQKINRHINEKNYDTKLNQEKLKKYDIRHMAGEMAEIYAGEQIRQYSRGFP